jgi:hypothetical protein
MSMPREDAVDHAHARDVVQASRPLPGSLRPSMPVASTRIAGRSTASLATTLPDDSVRVDALVP